jgi:hypothetical protein
MADDLEIVPITADERKELAEAAATWQLSTENPMVRGSDTSAAMREREIVRRILFKYGFNPDTGVVSWTGGQPLILKARRDKDSST